MIVAITDPRKSRCGVAAITLLGGGIGHALGWLDHGATIPGGCCDTRPAHIALLARRLEEKGHRIVSGPDLSDD